MPLLPGVGMCLLATALVMAPVREPLAQPYPSKPIRIIDAFAPGGTTDILARILMPRMSASLGQPLFSEAKTGANGIIGTEAAAKAPPDGYTFFIGSTSTLSVNQSLYKLNFDPAKDLAPLTMLVTQPLIVVVHPSVPVKSIAELVAYAKANPAAVNYATPGIGNPLHLATELFKKMTGAPMAHIPYNKGSAAALPDVLAGRVQVMFAPMLVLPYVKSGHLRALAVTSPERSTLPSIKDIPTVAESGVPGYEVTIWNAAAVPAGTPKDIVKRLNAEIVRVLEMPDVRKQLIEGGLEPIPSTPEAQAAFMLAETEKWSRVVKDAGIKIE